MVLIPIVLILLAAQNPWPETYVTQHYPGLISQMIYNPASVRSYTGTVEQIEIVPDIYPTTPAVHVQVQTDDKVVAIHLGPQNFLQGLGIDLKKGATLTATGSIVIYAGKEFMIAKSLEMNGTQYSLRRDDGTPLWKGEG